MEKFARLMLSATEPNPCPIPCQRRAPDNRPGTLLGIVAAMRLGPRPLLRGLLGHRLVIEFQTLAVHVGWSVVIAWSAP